MKKTKILHYRISDDLEGRLIPLPVIGSRAALVARAKLISIPVVLEDNQEVSLCYGNTAAAFCELGNDMLDIRLLTDESREIVDELGIWYLYSGRDKVWQAAADAVEQSREFHELSWNPELYPNHKDEAEAFLAAVDFWYLSLRAVVQEQGGPRARRDMRKLETLRRNHLAFVDKVMPIAP